MTKTLQEWYRYFNRKYFENKLPKDVIVRHAKLAKYRFGYTHFVDGKPKGIAINRNRFIPQKFIFHTLLHEMVHVKIGAKAKHGPRFHREMKRLAQAGAFVPFW